MSLYERARPLLFALPAETAHGLGTRTMRAAQATGIGRQAVRSLYRYRHPALAVERFGLRFPAPVGVAAGFDKNAEVTPCLADLGFGFAEVGTVTPDPQPGNARPRLFRLPEDGGMINRLGLNSQGADRVRDRLAGRDPAVPVGVNVGKMNDSGRSEAVADYRRGAKRLAPHADYLVVNVSCPNTPEEFDQGDPEYVERVLSTVRAVAGETPLLVKLGPDATPAGLAAVVDIVEDDADGFVATNTTTTRPELNSPHRAETGGLSGDPLEDRATEVVRTLAGLTDRPIVGVGGVRDAETAYRKIRAGACLVQLYTGFVYGGPGTARRINEGLVDLLAADGFDSVEDAVGVDA